jgi:hypothetical protein
MAEPQPDKKLSPAVKVGGARHAVSGEVHVNHAAPDDGLPIAATNLQATMAGDVEDAVTAAGGTPEKVVEPSKPHPSHNAPTKHNKQQGSKPNPRNTGGKIQQPGRS